MRSLSINGTAGLRGKIALPADKSIAHRAIIISALACGKTVISNFPANQDCLSTLKAFKKLGIKITRDSRGVVTVSGKGLRGLKRPGSPISAGESGTTLRLIAGVLAGQKFSSKLVAAKSLSRRPMLRLNLPLRMMGARISAKRKTQNAKLEEYPPLAIAPADLKAITYKMPVPSAQVKSAILLAALYARGTTRVIEPVKSRDHTERMLKAFNSGIKVQGNNIVMKGGCTLVSPGRIYVPGDISSAAFFIAAATIIPGSRLTIKNLGLNPSRAGIINVLKRMGADIGVRRSAGSATEPAGEVTIKNSRLKGTAIKREEIPSLIDELPVLMVVACLAEGRSIFEGAAELRVKETDRIRSMQENLKKMGAHIRVERAGKTENIIIEGGKKLKGTKVKSFSDHRTAMSMVIAGLAASGTTSIDDISCINKSFPDFLNILKPLLRKK
ncbi:MAG: 3-phosphoshikimate 1-carboxyvinyltransferase [Candidatus Omnitrophica bacterium]|nr:3-phosphoshikimate 1-carboxyvinyltransferase [Candidatus Omnitrophota bacterium]